MTRQLLKPLRFIENDQYSRIRESKTEKNQRAIGFLFPDVPEEIIHAFGALPFAIPGVVKDVQYAYSHLPSFACPFNLSPLEAALQGELDFMDGLVIPYNCDSMRAFSHVWEAIFPNKFTHSLWLPKSLDKRGAKDFLKQELLRMKDSLALFTGESLSTDRLRQSIGIYNRNRSLLRRLNLLRSKLPPLISNMDFMAIVRASMYMPKEEYGVRLEELLIWLSKEEKRKKPVHSKFARIFVFGCVCELDAIFEIFDQNNLVIIDDALYNVSRYFNEDVSEDGDLLENLAARYFRQAPISCYHYSPGVFAEHYKNRILSKPTDGVIYLNPSNCEVLQLDYPMIKGLLERMNIPSIFIETGHSSGSVAQVETRIQAFAEMLRDRKNGGI